MPAPRVLFLAQCLPYPPHSGVTNRSFHILQQLQKEFRVALVPFFRLNHQPDAGTLAASYWALREVASSIATPSPIRAEHFPPRRAWDHFRSVLLRRPYTYYEYASRAFQRQLRQSLAQGKPALVHLDSLVDLYRWLPELPNVPIVGTHHNVESQLLRRRAARMKSRVVAAYVRHQANLIERIERSVAPRCALNVTTSEIDAERLRALAPDAVTMAVPNGTDTEFLTPQTAAPVLPGRTAFLGPTYMFPNRDAVDYFLRDIWPAIRRCYPAATLQLIGRSRESDRVRHEATQGVTSLGYVHDVRPHLAAASCCIVPLRVGGGTRLKILDCWAMGKAVVSTSIGCEGLNAVDGENIIVRDDPDAFARAVVRVLSDARLRGKLETNARKTVERTYSWDTVGEALRKAYNHLID